MNDGFQYEEPLRPTGLDLQPTSGIAPGSIVVGDVSLGSEASVRYRCVLRGDLEPIRVRAERNIQDSTVVYEGFQVPAGRLAAGYREGRLGGGPYSGRAGYEKGDGG